MGEHIAEDEVDVMNMRTCRVIEHMKSQQKQPEKKKDGKGRGMGLGWGGVRKEKNGEKE